MAGHHNVSVLFDQLTPARRAAVEAEYQTARADRFHGELRRALQAAAEAPAQGAAGGRAGHVAASTVGKLSVDALRDLVKSLGGELEVSVVLSDGNRFALGDLAAVDSETVERHALATA